MRAFAVVLLGLLAAAPAAMAQGGHEESEDPAFVASCHDGQAPSGTTPCDVDGKADGTCTFGERDGKQIRVPVGKSQKFANSCHAVGLFSCDPPAPKIMVPPGAPAPAAPVASGRKAAPRAKTSSRSKAKPGFGDCKSDLDCVPTKQNGCLARGVMKELHDPWNKKVTCKCLKGPVMFGCVPRGSEWERLGWATQ